VTVGLAAGVNVMILRYFRRKNCQLVAIFTQNTAILLQKIHFLSEEISHKYGTPIGRIFAIWAK
jgi:hypothetical protein